MLTGILLVLVVSASAWAQDERPRVLCQRAWILRPPQPKPLTVTKEGCPEKFAVCLTRPQVDELAGALMSLVFWIDDTLKQCASGNRV